MYSQIWIEGVVRGHCINLVKFNSIILEIVQMVTIIINAITDVFSPISEPWKDFQLFANSTKSWLIKISS